MLQEMLPKCIEILKMLNCCCSDIRRDSINSNLSPNPKQPKKAERSVSQEIYDTVKFVTINPKECSSDFDDCDDSDDISLEYNKDCCFVCKGKDDLQSLQCSHKICYICINNQLQIAIEKEKVVPLVCICNQLIQSKEFEVCVDKESLYEYLSRLRYLKRDDYIDSIRQITLSNNKLCWICGFDHEGYKTCVDLNKSKNKIEKCEKCGNKPEYKLGCGHNFCKICLKSHMKKCLENAPFDYINCIKCTAIIQQAIINEIFDGRDNYARFQQYCIESSILSPSFECKICLLTFKMNKITTLDCDHRFCNECIKQYLRQKIESFEIMQSEIVCPVCNDPIDNNIIRGHVEDSLYEKYIDRSIKAFKVSLNDSCCMKWCKCGNGALVNKGIDFECPQCLKNKSSKKNSLDNPVINIDNFIERDIGTLDQIMEDFLKCPECREATFKDRGCNYVKCPWPGCSIHFCGLCSKILTPEEHYSHFKKSGPFGKTCNRLDNIKE